jgi:hypothetical protein
MALLFMDSFDHYASSFGGDGPQIAQKWTGGFTQISPGYGRHGNGCLGNAYVGLPNVTHPTVIVGAAVRHTYLISGNIFAIGDASGTYFNISGLQDGSIRTNIGRASAPDTLRLNTWHFIELAVNISINPLGYMGQLDSRTINTCRIWVDGALVLDETTLGDTGGTDPLTTTEFGWNLVYIGNSPWANHFDDLYICDGSGPPPWNTALGDVEIRVLRPNGPVLSEWTPAGAGVTNWDAVNDQVPDGDVTRVVATAAGPSDLYQFEDINTGNNIIGAQLLIDSSRTDQGFAGVAGLVRHAGVTTQLPERNITSTDYIYRNRDVLVKMPNGDPLTDAAINALQAGFTRTR